MSRINPSKIHVRNEVVIDVGTKQQKDIFAVKLQFLLKSPHLSQILLAYLGPELLAKCVEPETFISKSILKQYETELRQYEDNSGFFSCENTIFLAMTSTVFNDAYRKLRKTLPEHQKTSLETYAAYTDAVSRVYNLWNEIQFSLDVHMQVQPTIPRFRGILHENKVFKVIRDHVSLLHSLPVDEKYKEKLKRYKWKFLMSVVWIAMSVIYVNFFFHSLPQPWYIYYTFLALSLLVDVFCVCFVFPDIFQILDVKRKTKEIMKRNKFINIEETNFQKQKRIKALLFVDDC